MSRLYTLSEGTADRRRFPIFLVDGVDGLTPETGESGGQPQISKVGGAWANTTATLTAVGNGHYYVELTATELNTLGYFAVRYKSANTAEFNMDGQVINFDLMTAVTQTGDAFARLGAPAGASVSADILTIDNLVDDLESRLGTPSNLGSGATVAANLVDIEGQTDDIGVAGAGLSAIPAVTVGTINTNVVNANSLAADAVAEIQAGLATSAEIAAVQADTDNIQTRLPAALVSGRMDASVGAMANDVVTAASLNADAVTEIFVGVLRTALSEGYAADGAQPTLEQMAYMLYSAVAQFAVTGTSISTKRIDGTTEAMVFTTDHAVSPTSRVRTT